MNLPLASETEREAVRRIASGLLTCSHVLRGTIFGSRIRGDFTGDSDLDLLLIVTDSGNRDEAIGVLHDIELELDVPISPTIMTADEYEKNAKTGNAFIRNVEREGLIVYDARRE